MAKQYNRFHPNPYRNFSGMVGANPTSVAGISVPASCWNNSEFVVQNNANAQNAKNMASAYVNDMLSEENVWVNTFCHGMTESQCEKAILANSTGQAVAKFCPVQGGKSCASKSAIMEVQQALNVGVDGAWGKESQAALDKSGKTFQQILSSKCDPPVPHYGSGTAPPPPKPETDDGGGTSPLVWLFGIGAAAAVGWLLVRR